MKKEKVYLKGYVVGHSADTLGYKGFQIQLENMDIVEVDKNLVYKIDDEPQKVQVPQFVADWIEYAKNEEGYNVVGAVSEAPEGRISDWLILDNVNTFARAWINGYTVEEKRYLVKMKGISVDSDCLNYDSIDDEWYLASDIDGCNVRTHHTRKELEEAGFGDVFTSPLFEVEEVPE